MDSTDQKIQILEKHSFAIRWLHWINFPLMILMIWSGILIYWANQAYITIPDFLSEALKIDGRLAEGMGWHFTLMWFYFLNGLIYLGYLIITQEWKILIPQKKSFATAYHILLHDLHLKKEKPIQNGKLNDAQKIAYTLIILNGFFSIITGFAIYKPVQLAILTESLGGYESARLLHFISMCLFLLFMIVHLIQVIKSGWNNFRAMLTGYEIIEKKNEMDTK